MRYKAISVEKMRSLALITSCGLARYMKDANVVRKFGATPEVLIVIWKLLCPHLKENSSEPQHMLWWLYNCKHYPTESGLEKAIGVSAPTYRKHMKPIKEAFVEIRNQVVRTIDLATE